MKVTEEKMYAAFGLSQPETQEEPKDGEAESAAQEESAGEATQAEEVQGEEGSEAGNAEAEDDAQQDRDQEKGQREEERRATAARRRQQETQAAIDAAVQRAVAERDREHAAQIERFFQRASMSNPITGEPIRTMKDFEAWHQEQERERIQQELKDGKLTEETLSSLIEQSPTVQEMRRQQEQTAAQAKQAQDAEMEREVERQLAEIRKTDPSIHSVADLMNRPYSKELYEAVRRGNNFEDAFYLATRKQKEEVTAEAVQQAAVNKLRGKEHLRATELGGRAGATVTPEEEKYYRLFNPGATSDQIQAFQNKVKKG